MAIKVIKQGVKEFHITCPYCGCEFTYENEDVCNSEVICPCCLTNLPHKGVSGGNGDLVYRPFTLPDWATKSDNWSGCEGCPNNPKYLEIPYVGDSPCQWCQKSPWKITYASNTKFGDYRFIDEDEDE